MSGVIFLSFLLSLSLPPVPTFTHPTPRFPINHHHHNGPFLPVRVAVFYGGVPIKQNMDVLAGDQKPHIIVGTPGRILELVRKKALKLDHVKRFVLDECDKLLEQLGACVNPSINVFCAG